MQTENGSISSTSSDIHPFSQQIAGHKSDGKEVYGCLETSDGCILKPFQSGLRGPREKSLYENLCQIQNEPDDIVTILKGFLPEYHGSVTLNGVEYLKLENLTKPFSYPCGIDIKVGARTWDPDASEEKKRKEEEKYPPAKQIGYQILGMRVINPKDGTYIVKDKHYGRSLVANNVQEGLKLFLSGAGDRESVIILQIVQQLRNLQSWFEKQERFAFYATSVLITYEGSTISPNANIPSPSSNTTLASVRMIDFAHWFPSQCRDDNFLHGLENLIQHFNLI